jgi:3-phosphoshikimate 1-carboxyvinyltransferase
VAKPRTISLRPLLHPAIATVAIPGSKSYTNRALIMAAMSSSAVTLNGALLSDDTAAMIECLKKLGIKIVQRSGSISVTGSIWDIKDTSYSLDANLSGTTIRFILPLLALIPGTKELTGKPELNERPIKPLVEALRQMGAKIEYLGKDGFPPLRVYPSKLNAGKVRLEGSISSQYFSALLMVAPLFGDLTIEVKGRQISKPYIDMTIDSMRDFGVKVVNHDYKSYAIAAGQSYKINEYNVEGDFSSAGYLLAIASLTHSKLTLTNLNPASAQADRKIISILESMGNKVSYGPGCVTIEGKGVKPMNVDVVDFPDQAQTLSVLAAFADGPSIFSGVQSLRIKETERVKALETELAKMDITSSSTHKRLLIQGGHPKPALIDTYGDHRMAMSFAVAGAKLDGMIIQAPGVVSKTFPDFWSVLRSMGILSKPDNDSIVLIGMRGSGKSTVAKLLATSLGMQVQEMDEIIVGRSGRSIPEIVARDGWEHFRDLESSVLKEVLKLNNVIVSSGGGVVTRPQNLKLIKKSGWIIYLRANPITLASHIGSDSNRPPLTAKSNLEAELKQLLSERETLYQNVANDIIDTDALSPKQIVAEILRRMTQ